jgi:putative ABC transport system permease protein
MAYLSFLILALKRMRSRWVLALLSLLGIILTVALITSIPVFTDSVGFQILGQELASQAFGNANPAMALRYYRVPSAPEEMTMQQALDTGEWLGALSVQEVGLPIERTYTQIGSHAFILRALPDDTRYKERDLRQVRVNCVPSIEPQIDIIEGRPFSDADKSDELLVWARPGFLDGLGIKSGEEFELYNYNAVHPEVPFRFRVAGTWQAKDPNGAFWYRDPHDLMEEEFLTSVGAFSQFIAPYMPQQVDFTFWYFVLDEGRLRFDEVDRYTKGVEIAQLKAEGMLESIRVDRTPIEPLKDVQMRTRVLKRLLYGFSLPIISLLLFFVATISSIVVRYQLNETAIIMSRGASSGQVVLVSTVESLIQVALGVPLGILAGLGLAHVMGLNSGFLSFDRSESLPLAVQALDWRTVAIALVISLMARLIPTLRASRQTIVTYGQGRARSRRTGQALALMLDVVLIAATAYAINQLRARGTFGLINWQTEDGGIQDPLLFIAPALFIVTVGLLSAQLFPILMRLPDLLGGLLPSTSLYLGLRNLARESGTYTAPLFLLTLCLCLGAFEASIARGADSWLVDRLRYKAGSDFSFMLGVVTDGPYAGLGQDSWLLPATEYHRLLPEVTDATRVGSWTAIPLIGNSRRIRLLAIDRLDFSRVAYWRDDYASEPLGALLNRLGKQRESLLVTSDLLERYSLSIGDALNLDVLLEEGVVNVPFVIAGTFEQWPTVYEDEDTSSAVVANLDYVFDNVGGAQPHTIWLRTLPDTEKQTLITDLKNVVRVYPVDEVDSRTLIREDQQRLERVGIFGNLTVGFLAGSLLAWLGLLIYTFASLVSRVRRFTILRAIGLSLNQVLATLSVEYLIVILYGVLGGAIAGVATSQLFTRYFQFTEDPTVQVPSFRPEIAWTQIQWIVLAYLAVLVLAEVIVLARATRREAFQALRLGDEE